MASRVLNRTSGLTSRRTTTAPGQQLQQLQPNLGIVLNRTSGLASRRTEFIQPPLQPQQPPVFTGLINLFGITSREVFGVPSVNVPSGTGFINLFGIPSAGSVGVPTVSIAGTGAGGQLDFNNTVNSGLIPLMYGI
jgi:hypothetical protein